MFFLAVAMYVAGCCFESGRRWWGRRWCRRTFRCVACVRVADRLDMYLGGLPIPTGLLLRSSVWQAAHHLTMGPSPNAAHHRATTAMRLHKANEVLVT